MTAVVIPAVGGDDRLQSGDSVSFGFPAQARSIVCRLGAHVVGRLDLLP